MNEDEINELHKIYDIIISGKNAEDLSEDSILKCITNEHIVLDSISVFYFILAMKAPSKKFIWNCLINPNLKLDGCEKVQIIQKVDKLDEDFIYKCLTDQNVGLNSYDKFELIQIIYKDEKDIYKYISDPKIGFNRKYKIMLAMMLDEENFWSKYMPFVMKQEVKDDITIIDKKVQILKQLYQKNDEILETIDFKILDEKYVQTFGLDKINRIGLFEDIQRKILELDDKQYKFFNDILKNYLKRNKEIEWEFVVVTILDNITEYVELLNNIDDINNVNIEDLIIIMQEKNVFEINKEEDISNFDEIKRKKCVEWIETNYVNTMKNALCFQLFGHAWKYALYLLSKYNDIESIHDDKVQTYMKVLKEIEKIEDLNEIKEIFYSCEPAKLINKILIEEDLKNEYLRQFNEQLLTIDSLKEIEPNVYDAGTDFNIIITGVGAYSEEMKSENYRMSWNRPKVGVAHFCASYIRNDRLGIAENPYVCYGFNKMPKGSLINSSNRDLLSNGINAFVNNAIINSNFCSPESMINNTISFFNELDFKRFHDGKRTQPNYIIFFKVGEKEINEQCRQASRDFGNLPIVVIDVCKCIEEEEKKVKGLLKLYKETGNIEILKQIYQKVINNRVTTYKWNLKKEFYQKINLDEIESVIKSKEQEKKVSENDLEENDKRVSVLDRLKYGSSNCMEIIRKLLKSLSKKGMNNQR